MTSSRVDAAPGTDSSLGHWCGSGAASLGRPRRVYRLVPERPRPRRPSSHLSPARRSSGRSRPVRSASRHRTLGTRVRRQRLAPSLHPVGFPGVATWVCVPGYRLTGGTDQMLEESESVPVSARPVPPGVALEKVHHADVLGASSWKRPPSPPSGTRREASSPPARKLGERGIANAFALRWRGGACGGGIGGLLLLR